MGLYLSHNTFNSLLEDLSRVEFASSDDEIVTVAAFISSYVRAPNPLPYIHLHKGRDFSARTLVSMSFFRQAMERRMRHGCPPPEFYNKTAILFLKQEKLDELARHFIRWESWIQENFV